MPDDVTEENPACFSIAPKPPDEIQRIRGLDSLGILDTSSEKRFDNIVTLAAKLFAVSISYVALVDRDRQWFKSKVGLSAGETPRRIAFCSHTILQDEPLIVLDAFDDPRFAQNPLVVGEPFIRFYAGVPLREPGGYKVGTLCLADQNPREFNARDVDLVKHLGRLVEREFEAQEKLIAITQELAVAARIQQSILPCTFPPFPNRKDFELHAAMVPAKEVGGDLYDLFLLDEHRVGFVIGDVSGKGVPAALLMAVSRTLLRAIALQNLPPGECLQYVNSVLAEQNNSNMFVTLFYGILDTRTGELQYANGGHNTPYVFSREGDVRPLPGDESGILVGVMPGARYETSTYNIVPGEAILLYTDGVTEASNQSDEFFSDERLEKFLADRGASSVQQVVSDLHAAVQSYAAGMPQADDITILALRYIA